MKQPNEKDALVFRFNWNNKLECNAFSTIRISGRFEIGQVIDITCPSAKLRFEATVKDKRRFMLDQVNEFIAYIDTGYNLNEFHNIIKKMHPGYDFNTNPIYMYLLVKKP